MFHRALLFAAGVGLCFAGTVSAEPVDYIKQIKPILAEKCYSCHGVLKQESDLRLETRELMLKGGASGPVIVPGQPDKSLVLERVSAQAAPAAMVSAAWRDCHRARSLQH